MPSFVAEEIRASQLNQAEECHMLVISRIVSVKLFVDRMMSFHEKALRQDKPIYSIK